MTLLLFVLGLGGLIVGAELLVRGAVRLAAAVGLSPLVIGLTVVAYGTSAPELVVSLKAGLSGQADLSIGIVIEVSLLLLLFACEGTLSRWEGAVLSAGAVLYTVFCVRQSRKEPEAIQVEYAEGVNVGQPDAKSSWGIQVALMVVGLVLLVLGAHWLVTAVVHIATALGLSKLVISRVPRTCRR